MYPECVCLRLLAFEFYRSNETHLPMQFNVEAATLSNYEAMQYPPHPPTLGQAFRGIIPLSSNNSAIFYSSQHWHEASASISHISPKNPGRKSEFQLFPSLTLQMRGPNSTRQSPSFTMPRHGF